MQNCVYCGEPASTRDHVVPYSYSGRVPVRGRTGGGGDAGRTVPACHSCNSWLGNRLLVKVEDRRAYIAGVLRRKVNESAPGWTEEELEDLGPSLRQAVESGLREHSRLLGRLGYAESGSC